MLKMAHDNWQLWIDPLHGGALLGAKWKDIWVMPDRREILRSRVSSFSDRQPFPEASFLLVPWSNRIKNSEIMSKHGVFKQERPHEHGLHGEGWNSEWRVLKETQQFCELLFTRPQGSLFPWAYDVRYVIQIGEDTLEQQLTITNSSAMDGFFGCGFHPYFSRLEETTLSIESEGQYPMGFETGLPIENAQETPWTLQLGKGLQLQPSTRLDDCFKVKSPNISVFWPQIKHKLNMKLKGDASHLVIYNPEEPWFAIEPVSHVNNDFGDFPFAEKKYTPPGGSVSVGYSLSLEKFE